MSPEPNGNRKRSRKRSSGRGKASDGGGKGRNRSKAPKVDPAQFWGDADAVPRVDAWATSTPDVKAVVASLGRPPVPGHETPAEHWFSLVYERAAVLAGALAAAGDLDAVADEAPGSDDEAARA